ncbi:MAG: 3-methyl-2-oxobutanoate hydroxymethyltransferase [Chitinispirillaceae bacterium]|nr:3-methyl-2-oxobutanoate hydroxymethyltransferase [Chitinispirillaceae bacterium]
MKKTIEYLQQKKARHEPITMVTAYDYTFASIEDAAGVDAILVGDSVGTNMLGYGSEREVTMADMLHHTAAVARAVRQAFILADLPYRSAETVEDAVRNAGLLAEKGAACVKLEGWNEVAPVIKRMSGSGLTVCGHIGYNPQIHGATPRQFGKTAAEAHDLIQSAVALQDAGAQLVIVETIAEEVAGEIAATLAVPVIGIGSGKECDGQVLVVHDLLGMVPRTFRHVKRYCDMYHHSLQAVTAYITDVQNRHFPMKEHAFHMDQSQRAAFKNDSGKKHRNITGEQVIQ